VKPPAEKSSEEIADVTMQGLDADECREAAAMLREVAKIIDARVGAVPIWSDFGKVNRLNWN
jgi:hypothetical protein